MALITTTDINTHIYSEIINEITRGDDTIIQSAIDSGTAEVQSYLERYDIDTLFGGTLPDAVVSHLKFLCKNIICWHVIILCNPNIDLKLFRTLYEDAITFLTKVQQGKASPNGWPYLPDDPTTKDYNENDTVQWWSNRKRRQSF